MAHLRRFELLLENPKNALLSALSTLNSSITSSDPGNAGLFPSAVSNVASDFTSTGQSFIGSATTATGFTPSISTNITSGIANMDSSGTNVIPGETGSLPSGSTNGASGTGSGNLSGSGGTASNGVQTFPSPTNLPNESDGTAASTVYRLQAVQVKMGPTGTPSVISGGSQGFTATRSQTSDSVTGADPSNTFEQSDSSFPGISAGQSGTDISNAESVEPSRTSLGSQLITTGLYSTSTGSAYSSASSSVTGSGKSDTSGDLTGLRVAETFQLL